MKLVKLMKVIHPILKFSDVKKLMKLMKLVKLVKVVHLILKFSLVI